MTSVDRLGRYKTTEAEGADYSVEWEDGQCWWCLWCDTKYHSDDPMIVHPEGDFCSEACLARWGAKLFLDLVWARALHGRYTLRQCPQRRRVRLEINKDIREVFGKGRKHGRQTEV
jgi:hypothetical protein